MAIEPVVLRPGDISLGELRRIAEGASVSLDPSSRAAVRRAQATVGDTLKRGESVYGINTGFGLLAKTRIEPARLRDLQRNLILSHAVGTGPLLPRPVVRLILALKAASLARGHSGVRWSVIEALMALLTQVVLPCIPAKGSVGASGDLAPLAHPLEIGARLRPDEVTEPDLRSKFQQIAPETDKGFYLVPRVIE